MYEYLIDFLKHINEGLNMKVLMIGGTGVISFDVTQKCLDLGYDVYLFNRGNRNKLQHPNLHYIIGDINQIEQSKEKLQSLNMHFDVIADFIIFDQVTMKKRMDIYNSICKQFVFISSATIFSKNDDIISECSKKGNDNWKYSRDKLECERLLIDNCRQYDFKYTIVRPYITYDKRRIPFPVITKKSYYSLLYRILKEKPVIICDSGTNIVTLTHTLDFAIAITGLFGNSKAFNEDFNITGTCTSTWNEILQIVEKRLNKKATVVYIPSEELAELFPSEHDELLYDKSCNHIFDNSKICDAVPEFKTTWTVEEGLSETVRHIMESDDLQKVDWTWNAVEDVIVSKHSSNHGEKKYYVSLNSKFLYYVFQRCNNNLVRRVVRKIIRIMGGLS